MTRVVGLLVLITLLALQQDCHAAAIPESESTQNKTLHLALLVPFTVEWTVGTAIASAITPAIASVHEMGLLPGYDIEWSVGDSGCVSQMGFQAMIDIWRDIEDLDGIIGAFCSVVCQPTSFMAAALNIPVVSCTCTSSALSDKELYPTFTRVVGIEEMLAPLINALMDEFGWDRVALVTSPADLHTGAAKETKTLLESHGKTVYYHVVNPTFVGETVDATLLQQQLDVVRTVKKEAHFVVLFMYYREIRVFLINAYKEGMINGEYIYFGNEMITIVNQTSSYEPNMDNAVIFEGFFSLTPRLVSSPLWESVKYDIVDAFNDSRFDPYDVIDSVEEVNDYAGFVYDALLLWAYGVNRTLEQGGEPDDGLAVAKNIFNFTFTGGVTGDVSIDYKGDRKFDQTLSIIQPGKQVVELFHWHAADGWLEKTYLPGTSDFSGLVWGAGSTTVPAGSPACGWQGELCPPEPTDLSVPLGVGIPLTLLISIAVGLGSYYFHRKRYLKMHEEALKCVFDFNSIDLRTRFTSVEDLDKLDLKISDLENEDVESIEQTPEYDTDIEKELISSGTKAGMWNGEIAALRGYVNKGTAVKDDKLLVQINHLKSISQENLAQFIGVAVNPKTVVLLTEYSPKGSVKDLIDDINVNLSLELKTSLIADIACGLKQLHASLAKYHGHLTSTNCIVDRRWVCKLTDFGFEKIRGRQTFLEQASAESKLWTAPEILRREATFGPEGDIYSFGVIVQEILMDTEPFGGNLPPLTHMETLQLVRNPGNSIYRPYIDPTMCHSGWIDMAVSCWGEDPAKRPSPADIVKMIRTINGGKLPKLVDSMIKNLEKQTDHLEEIVTLKCVELYEEQKKMDLLLSQLLPPSISKQLKEQGTVEPETFDEVSMFFSDIVGFTRVSAQSTPIQIVYMLNLLYSEFDQIVDNYDVYKVATIGDAYVVGSGVPIRNGDKHAGEIAGMALDMMTVLKGFKIPHIPNEMLFLRIGLHTGPCVAGITGTRSPRYLLFGKTVEMGARIEAAGEKMRIHMSNPIAQILFKGVEFDIEYRGEMEMKGEGMIKTYWLNGRNTTRESVRSIDGN